MRYTILATTMLIAYLVISLVEDFLLAQTTTLQPYQATIVGMVAVVVLFVPLFGFLDKASRRIVDWVVRKSGRYLGRIGLYVVLFLVLGVLYCAYLYRWFGIKIIWP